jgi:hypothetical protein
MLTGFYPLYPLHPCSKRCGLEPIAESPELQLGTAEIEKETYRDASCLEVVHHLRHVFWSKGFHGFQFQKDSPLNQDIRPKVANVPFSEVNFHRKFWFSADPGISKGNEEGVLVDRFDEPAAKFVTDVEAGGDDPFRQVINDQAVTSVKGVPEEVFIPFITCIPVSGADLSVTS